MLHRDALSGLGCLRELVLFGAGKRGQVGGSAVSWFEAPASH